MVVIVELAAIKDTNANSFLDVLAEALARLLVLHSLAHPQSIIDCSFSDVPFGLLLESGLRFFG